MYRSLAMLLVAVAMAFALQAASGAASAQEGGEPEELPPLRIVDVAPDGGSVFHTAPEGVEGIDIWFNRGIDIDTLWNGRNARFKREGWRKWRPLVGGLYGDNWATLWGRQRIKPDTTYQVQVDLGKGGVRGEQGGWLSGAGDPTVTVEDGKVTWSFTTAR